MENVYYKSMGGLWINLNILSTRILITKNTLWLGFLSETNPRWIQPRQKVGSRGMGAWISLIWKNYKN